MRQKKRKEIVVVLFFLHLEDTISIIDINDKKKCNLFLIIFYFFAQEESQLRLGKTEKQQLSALRPDKPDLPASTCLPPHHHSQHHQHHHHQNLKNENSSRVLTIPTSYETFERDHTSTVTSCQVTSLQTSLSRDRCKVKGINQNVMEEQTKTPKSEVHK